MTQTMRLDRLLANLGYGSRKEIQLLAKDGAVTLDGERLKKVDGRLELTPDLPQRLRVDGEPLDPLPGLALMLNKPLGVTCSAKDAGPLVHELLPWRWRMRKPAISTIGRLDKDTSGLLLMTDDGEFLHRVISPKSHVDKRYRVTLDRPMNGDEAALFASGEMMLEDEDKPLLPAKLETVSETEAYLTISEGRYHQVRRMFAATGNHVTALHRDRVGGLELPDDLPEGEFRHLGADDIEKIFAPG